MTFILRYLISSNWYIGDEIKLLFFPFGMCVESWWSCSGPGLFGFVWVQPLRVSRSSSISNTQNVFSITFVHGSGGVIWPLGVGADSDNIKYIFSLSARLANSPEWRSKTRLITRPKTIREAEYEYSAHLVAAIAPRERINRVPTVKCTDWRQTSTICSRTAQ